MKIESVTPQPAAAAKHPLSELFERIEALPIGAALRVSELPSGFEAASADELNAAIKEDGLSVKVESDDRSRTPEFYIITRVG